MQLNLDLGGHSVPYLSNWLGPWAMEETRFHALRHQVESSNLIMHLSNDQNRQEAIERAEDAEYSVVEGIAVLNLNGPLMKHAPSMSGGCSTVVARRQIGLALNDPNVKGILLRIESPGGTVSGTKELADTIAKARQTKPVWAFCNDLTASAAYWIASQCDRIEANPTSLVGSIGTYMVVADSSKAAEKAGIEVHVVRAGAFKGTGTPGTEITDEQLADMDKTVSGLNQFFLQAVESGRSLSREQVITLADGRCHLASEAKRLDLIDDVSSFEDFFDRFVSFVSTPTNSVVSHEGEKRMSTENTGNTVAVAVAVGQASAATALQIRQAFPKASAEWTLKCLENGWSLDQCRTDYCNQLQASLEDSEKKRLEAEKKAQQLAKGKPGVSALKPKSRKARSEYEDKEMEDDKDEVAEDEELMEDDMEEDDMEEEDDVVAKWNRLVDREAASCGGNRQKATAKVAKRYPGLRSRLVQVANARRRVMSRR